jgi:hypothetical protein
MAQGRIDAGRSRHSGPLIHNPSSLTVEKAGLRAIVFEESDLAFLEVDVAQTHVIATPAVLLLAVHEPHCHSALDLSLWLPMCCILQPSNTTASEGYVQSALSVSMNVAW